MQYLRCFNRTEKSLDQKEQQQGPLSDGTVKYPDAKVSNDGLGVGFDHALGVKINFWIGCEQQQEPV